MASDRRKFMKIAGATVAVAGATLATTATVAQAAKQFNNIKALAFDAYGTLFDVFSVTALCEQLFPGKSNQLAQIWRAKQLQYSLMRSQPPSRLLGFDGGRTGLRCQEPESRFDRREARAADGSLSQFSGISGREARP
jgi:hypothetical protein